MNCSKGSLCLMQMLQDACHFPDETVGKTPSAPIIVCVYVHYSIPFYKCKAFLYDFFSQPVLKLLKNRKSLILILIDV